MKVMILEKSGDALVLKNIPKPIPNENQVLIKVNACF